MATWDIVRVRVNCSLCNEPMGAGEPCRLSPKFASYRYCETCSVNKIDGESAPPDLPVFSIEERLKALQQASANARATEDFGMFNRNTVASTVRNAILDNRQKRSGERE